MKNDKNFRATFENLDGKTAEAFGTTKKSAVSALKRMYKLEGVTEIIVFWRSSSFGRWYHDSTVSL